MIDRTSDVPLYRQLAAILRDQIAAGQMAPGRALSERALSQTYGLGMNAVRDALHVLGSEGLIATRRGVPAQVCEPPEGGYVQVVGPAIVEVRQPTGREQRALGITDGHPVVVVRTTAGDQAYPAATTKLRVE